MSYDEALRQGDLVERFRRHPGESLLQAVARSRDPLRFGREALLNKLRAAGLLFREPFRHFSVRPGAFDVVHAHVYSVGLTAGDDIALVLSNSIQIDALYRDAFGLAPSAVARRRRRDIRLAAVTGVTHSAYGHAGADVVVCFSEHLRETFLRGPHNANADYVVIPPGIDPGPEPTRPTGGPFHVGFIGDWHAKGGDVVLAAYRDIVDRGVPARLTVVGGEPRLGAAASENLNIQWLPRQPRDVLLEEIVPSLSAFAYPSRFDGLPLTLLEVMARGVPVVVSDYGALPEVVQYGRAGLVVERDDVAELSAALRSLLDPKVRTPLSSAGRRRVLDRYCISRVSGALGEAYVAALERGAARKAT